MMVERARQLRVRRRVVEVAGKVMDIGRWVPMVGGLGMNMEVIGVATMGRKVLVLGRQLEMEESSQVVRVCPCQTGSS
jgi:hypothetical protein